MNGEWASGRNSSNSHPLSLEAMPVEDVKISHEESSAADRELKLSHSHSSSSFVTSTIEPLKDTFHSPKVARKESHGSLSSISDSARSTVSDGFLSDSFKCSSPEGGPEQPRRASLASLPLGRFSVPVDTSPALPRRLSEPVLTHHFDFDLPKFRRPRDTDLGFSMGDPPRASHIECDKSSNVELEGMGLRDLGIADDAVDWDSDLTRTDGEGGQAARKGPMAASVKPSPEHVSHRRPRRQGHRNNTKDPNTEHSPKENPSSPTNRGRSRLEWLTKRKAMRGELRWLVNSPSRWRGRSSDDRLQKPCRRKRDARPASSETGALVSQPSRTPRVANRKAVKAQDSFVSPPVKDGGIGADRRTPATSRLTPSPTESHAGSLREKVMSLDCPPPL